MGHEHSEHTVPLPPSVTDCFQHMVQLLRLRLLFCKHMASLAFLASPPCSSTLTHLELWQPRPRLPASQLPYLLQLRALEWLELHHVFEQKLTARRRPTSSCPPVCSPRCAAFSALDEVHL